MAEYVHLVGAEEVSRAAASMRNAAEEMQRAATNIEATLDQHHRFLDDWLSRLDATLQDRIHDSGVTQA